MACLPMVQHLYLYKYNQVHRASHLVATPTPQPRNNGEASSSSDVNMNTDIGGGRTLGDVLKSLDDANKV